METIMAYLDNMFAGLPTTPETTRLRQELMSGMEDKYLELKMEGKSENEAIGIVISEFGNIEELTSELGIQPISASEATPVLTEADAYDYIATKRMAGLWTGIGVFLCACGVALLMVIDTLFENSALASPENNLSDAGVMLGLIGMFVLIAIAVGMFIYNGMKLDRFKHLEHSFQLPYTLTMELKRSQAHFSLTYRVSLITGVCLCILSPVFIFATSYINDDYAPYGVAAFMVTAAVAVFLFIYYGNIQGAYTTLLKEPPLMKMDKEERRTVKMVEAIVRPLATAIFLFTGFVYHRWDVNWAIFPIVGILLSMFTNVYQISKQKDMS